tara:strand:- start:113 stop:535 length:423 start_codon:yes stop_codon:yes gene_type:complete
MGRVFFGVRDNVHSITADYQALAGDSGKNFYMNAAAGATLTLPAISDAQEGWNCTVTVATVTTSNNYIITEATASDTNKIVSLMSILEIDTNDDGLTNTGHTTITFEGTPALGDHVRITCDGSKWYAVGLGVSDDFVALA